MTTIRSIDCLDASRAIDIGRLVLFFIVLLVFVAFVFSLTFLSEGTAGTSPEAGTGAGAGTGMGITLATAVVVGTAKEGEGEGAMLLVVTTSGTLEVAVTTSGTLVVAMAIADDKNDGGISSTIIWKGSVVTMLLGRRGVVVTFPLSGRIRVVNMIFGVGTSGVVRVGVTLGVGFEGPGAKKAMPAATTAVRMRTGGQDQAYEGDHLYYMRREV